MANKKLKLLYLAQMQMKRLEQCITLLKRCLPGM